MSGSSLTSTCPKCNAENQLRGKAFTLALTCSSCGVYFRRGSWNKEALRFTMKEEPVIPVGSKGRIKDVSYEVMGFVVKCERKYRYTWHEYLLFNPYQGYIYLSTYDGHWNLIEPIENDPRNHALHSDFTHEGRAYHLYQKYRADVVYAKGEFFLDIVDITDSTLNSEYIAPPNLFGLEQSDDSMLWYRGEYIRSAELAQAFKLPKDKFPKRKGIGYTQPTSTSFSETTLIRMTLLFLAVVLVMQFMINSTASEKVVYQGSFNQNDLGDQKFFKTPSFDLEGASKNLEINLAAPISNDWFFGEFSLINDNDGSEYNFTKEFEYYHGYEDGYAWSEGSTTGEALLSQIPAGRYHINIYPEFSPYNHEFSIAVTRDVTSNGNLLYAWIALAIFPVGFYIRKNYVERKRWRDSDYSPYE